MARARRQTQRKETGVKGARILVVEARYYDDIADLLLRGAKRVLKDAQATFDLVTVAHDVEALDGRAAGIRGDKRAEDVDDGGLAGAVGAEQSEDRSPFDRQVEVLQHLDLAERLGDAPEGDRGGHGWGSFPGN